MSIPSLIKDSRQSRKRLLENPPTTVAQLSSELANNVYPMMQAMLNEMVEVDEVVQEMIDQTESFIQPELAEQIVASLAAAGHLAKLVVELVEGADLDDLRRKKLADAVAAFEDLAAPALVAVSEASVGDVGDMGEDEDEDGEDEDGEDEDGEDEDEAAAEEETNG